MTIDQAITALAAVTLFELMVTIGLGVTLGEIAGVARNWRLLARAATASYLVFPAAAVGLLLLFGASPVVAAGFLIAAVCAGAPYGPPFTALANGNVVASTGLMVLLAGSSALLAPLLLALLLPVTSAGASLEIDTAKLVGTLLVAQFLPLCLGLAVRRWRPALAERLKGPAGVLSLVLNVALVGLILAVQFDMLIAIPVRAYLGMFALVLVGVAAGWLLGGPGYANRSALVMATAVRNVGVTLVIATASFPGTPAVTAATAFGLFQTVLMALVALGWGRVVAPGELRQADPGAAAPAGAGLAKGASHG